jgi:hypothetical protein
MGRHQAWKGAWAVRGVRGWLDERDRAGGSSGAAERLLHEVIGGGDGARPGLGAAPEASAFRCPTPDAGQQSSASPSPLMMIMMLCGITLN